MDSSSNSEDSLNLPANVEENRDHDCENPENNPDAFTILQNIAENIRSQCNYVICDTVLRYYAEHDFASKITVKEFFDKSKVLAGLEDKLIKTIPEFDKPCEFAYMFDDDFYNKPVRQELKNYVSYYFNILYENDAPRDYFIEAAQEFMPYRDRTYLCEAFPKENEELNAKGLAMFLNIAAVLSMLDECKKKNVLANKNTL